MMAIRLWSIGNGNPIRLPSLEITLPCRVSHKWFPSSGNYSCWRLGQVQTHVSHPCFFIYCPFGVHTPSEKGRDNLQHLIVGGRPCFTKLRTDTSKMSQRFRHRCMTVRTIWRFSQPYWFKVRVRRVGASHTHKLALLNHFNRGRQPASWN